MFSTNNLQTINTKITIENGMFPKIGNLELRLYFPTGNNAIELWLEHSKLFGKTLLIYHLSAMKTNQKILLQYW